MQQTVSFRPRSTKRLRLTDFKADPYQVFFTDGSGTMQEVPLGASNTVLTSAGPNVPPTFQPTGVAGTLVGTASTGLGIAVAGNIVAGVAQFRTLAGSSGVGIVDDGNTLTFSLVPSLLPAFTGATLAVNGLPGGVPAPAIADRNRYLRGDGVWADAPFSAASSTGTGASLVYASTAAGTVLRSVVAASSRVVVTQNANDVSIDVVTANLPVFAGATSSAAGARGLVPAPAPGDQVKFLRGDGTWQAPAVIGMANVGGGAGIYKDYTTQQNLRSLRSLNANLTLVQSTDEITLDLSDAVVTVTMVGATAATDGTGGLTPKPYVADRLSFLRGDGQWAIPTIASAAENVGAGVDVFQAVSVLNALQFRRIASANSIIAVSTANDSVILTFNLNFIPDVAGATPTVAGTRGMVPAPPVGADDQFLRGDGTWASPSSSLVSGAGIAGDIAVYLGATAGISKIALIRPVAPLRAQAVGETVQLGVDEFFGALPTAAGGAGLVPAPIAGSGERYLSASGGWQSIPVMVGATSSTPSVSGLVPVASAGSDGRFLRGDGAWVDISGIGEVNTASNAGGGIGLFRAKSGVDLTFKSLVAASGISLTAGTDTVTIAVNAGALSAMTGATAVLDGAQGMVPIPHAGDNGKVLYGDGIWRVPPGATGGEANTVANIGTGVPLFIQKSGVELDFRTLLSTSAALLVTGSAQTVNFGFDQTQLAAFTGASPTVAGVRGEVPAPAAGDDTKFLRGDGTWQVVVTTQPNYTGATAGTPGVAGLVPPAAAGQEGLFLRGDGTWQTASTLVPQYVGATPTTAGVTGTVPPAAAGADQQFLRGDGTWATVGAGSIDAANLGGTGVGVYAGNVAGVLGFKSIKAAIPAVVVTDSVGDHTIALSVSNYFPPDVGGVIPSVAGLVPAAGGVGDRVKFLQGDGTWANVQWGTIGGALTSQGDLMTALNAKSDTGHVHVAFTGASPTANGVAGFVPQPVIGDQGRFLRGDGTWATIVSGDVAFVGATASVNGSLGAVPAPLAGDQGKVLYGDGTWKTPTGGGGGGSSSTIPGLSGLTALQAYRYSGTAWVFAVADGPNNAEVVGIASDAATITTAGIIVFPGGLVPGGDYWLSPTTPGAIVTPEPVWLYGQVRVFIGTAISTTQLQLAIDLGDVILNASSDIATKIYARAHPALAQYYGAAGTYTVINFDTVDADAADITTGIAWHFTSPRTTRYFVSAQVGLAVAQTADLIIAIFVNGALYSSRNIAPNSAGSQGTVEINDLVPMSINDVLDIRLFTTLTGNIWSAMCRVAIAEI